MATGDDTSRRDSEPSPMPPIKAECQSLQLALERAGDTLSAVIEVLQQTAADVDKAAEWLAALVAPDLKRKADVTRDRGGM